MVGGLFSEIWVRLNCRFIIQIFRNRLLINFVSIFSTLCSALLIIFIIVDPRRGVHFYFFRRLEEYQVLPLIFELYMQVRLLQNLPLLINGQLNYGCVKETILQVLPSEMLTSWTRFINFAWNLDTGNLPCRNNDKENKPRQHVFLCNRNN